MRSASDHRTARQLRAGPSRRRRGAWPVPRTSPGPGPRTSQSFYRHGFNRRVIYSEGVRFLAEADGAYWLIDAIASYIGSRKLERCTQEDPRLAEIQFWQLDVLPDGTATLSCRADADVASCISQAIGFTDFPLAQVRIWAAPNGQGWTLYLPSEH